MRPASRMWNSPTLMSWVSASAKSGQLLLVLPVALIFLRPAEIAVWLMFTTIMGLQLLTDAGITPTTTRALSLALAGVPSLSRSSPREAPAPSSANNELLAKIMLVMRANYLFLSLASLTLLGLVGTAALLQPIANVPDPTSAWVAWLLVLMTSAIAIYSNLASAYLRAVGRIAEMERVRTFVSLGGTLSGLAALMVAGDLLALVATQQAWQVLLALWLHRAARSSHSKPEGQVTRQERRSINAYIWPASWRSAVGILIGYSVIQGSGLVYAQFAGPAQAASYLLVLRLLVAVNQYSLPPFYTKLPELSRLWGAGDRRSLRRLALRGMQLSLWVHVLAVMGLAVFYPVVLHFLNRAETYLSIPAWLLFGLAALVERYGAMHLQLVTLSNIVVWHVASAFQGAVFVAVSAMLVPLTGLYGFALAMTGSAVAYACYTLWASVSAGVSGTFRQELSLLAPPVMLLLVALGLSFWWGR